jgi:GNAT superfamily N-acetyltransferase
MRRALSRAHPVRGQGHRPTSKVLTSSYRATTPRPMMRTADPPEVVRVDGRGVNLERARREAKALVRAARDRDHVALARLRASGSSRLTGLGNDELIAAARLADGQLAVARELGARSWPALVRLAGEDGRAVDGRPVTPPPSYGELGWTMQAAYLGLLAQVPGVEARPVGDGVAVRTGVPSNAHNGVAGTDFADVDVTEVVASLADVPAKWLVGPEPSPADLGERLAAAGAEPERRMVFMGAELADLDTASAAGAEVVSGPAQLEEWLRVAGECEFMEAETPEDRRRWAHVLAGVGLGGTSPVQHLLARRAGRAIALASIQLQGGAACLVHLGVLPGERGRGVGRALARAALHAAAESGCRQALVEPDPDALAFFGRLGFRVVAWPPDRTWYLPLRQRSGGDLVRGPR